MVMTFGEMIFIPASSAYVVHIAPTKSKGEYLGLYTTAFNVAFLIAALAGTQALERLGPTVLWLSAFAFGLLSTAMLLGLSDSGPAKEEVHEEMMLPLSSRQCSLPSPLCAQFSWTAFEALHRIRVSSHVVLM